VNAAKIAGRIRFMASTLDKLFFLIGTVHLDCRLRRTLEFASGS